MASSSLRFFSFLGLALLLLLPSEAIAWTPEHHLTIAWEAARLAPRDLYRQILRNKEAFEAGVLAAPEDAACEKGRGGFEKTAAAQAEGAVRAIRDHKPFAEIVQQLGRLTRCLAWANNPLSMGEEDAEEARYAADFARYAASAEPRFPLLFYGLRTSLDHSKDLTPLLADTVKRGRAVYPRIGEEYRRIDFASGIGRFDDRSTAFGVASVSFSHSITDAALAMRFVWLRAGGADPRTSLPRDGNKILQLSRAGRPS